MQTTLLLELQKLIAEHHRPPVVALDGGSGSGKSTLAQIIKQAVDTAVVPVDDFFAADIPDARWDTFSVTERLEHVFDWSRLRADVIKPLQARQKARWYAFDFVGGLQSDGTYGMQTTPTTLAPAQLILLDGAYTAGPPLSDVVDFSILVDVPLDERHRRLAQREDADFLAHWHQRWDPVEAYYFDKVRPNSSFDLIIQNDAD